MQPAKYSRLRIVTGIHSSQIYILDVWCAGANDPVACACVGVSRSVFVGLCQHHITRTRKHVPGILASFVWIGAAKIRHGCAIPSRGLLKHSCPLRSVQRLEVSSQFVPLCFFSAKPSHARNAELLFQRLARFISRLTLSTLDR